MHVKNERSVLWQEQESTGNTTRLLHFSLLTSWQRTFRGGASLTIATSEPQHKRSTVRHLVKTRSRFGMKEAPEGCTHATSH